MVDIDDDNMCVIDNLNSEKNFALNNSSENDLLLFDKIKRSYYEGNNIIVTIVTSLGRYRIIEYQVLEL